MRKVNGRKIRKMLQNWQKNNKYAPQTDNNLDRESSVTQNQTENGTINEQQLNEKRVDVRELLH